MVLLVVLVVCNCLRSAGVCAFVGGRCPSFRTGLLLSKTTRPSSGCMPGRRKEIIRTASSVHSDGPKPAQQKASSSTADTDHWTQPSPAPVKMRKAPVGSTNNVVPAAASTPVQWQHQTVSSTDAETFTTTTDIDTEDLVSGSPQPPPDVQALWEQLPAELQRGLRFVQVLGSGYFGVVVLAEKRGGAADEPTLWADNCELTGQRLRCDDGSARVAVKLVRPRTGEHALAIREGLVLSAIASSEPSVLIPKCLDYGMCSSGLVYSIIEFFAGVPLDEFLEQEGPLPPREVARIGFDICEALSVIHRAGFTYGDIKAQNIIRSRMGDTDQAIYRLIDFGSASGFLGCLFGGMYDSVPGVGDLTPAKLAPLVLSGALPESWRAAESWCGEGCRVEEDEETVERLAGAWRALSSNSLPAHWRQAVDQTTGNFYDLGDVTTQREGPSEQDNGAADGVEEKALEWFAALLRQQDEVSGTPAYMAPEQMLQSRALITPQTDIYNLAALLFYLASQCFPLPPATARKWLQRVQRGQERDMELVSEERRQQLESGYQQHLAALFDAATPRLCHVIHDPQVMNSRGMAHLDDILSGALHKYPSLRYGDARQMQQRLSSLVCDLE